MLEGQASTDAVHAGPSESTLPAGSIEMRIGVATRDIAHGPADQEPSVPAPGQQRPFQAIVAPARRRPSEPAARELWSPTERTVAAVVAAQRSAIVVPSTADVTDRNRAGLDAEIRTACAAERAASVRLRDDTRLRAEPRDAL